MIGPRSKVQIKRSPEPSLLTRLETYFGYALLVTIGRIRDYFGQLFYPHDFRHLHANDGYAPLNEDFDNFYARRLKRRLDDCFARVSVGIPGRVIHLLEPRSPPVEECEQLKATTTLCLNFGSYNYLGFAEAEGPCADATREAISDRGISAAWDHSGWRLDLHVKTEEDVAAFLGKPAAVIMSMGFSTNVCAIEALVDSRGLIVSDQLNHASIRFASRLTGARLAIFKHNDGRDLERVLRAEMKRAIPSKILVVVEGLYSMEGSICDLPEILKLKARYKFSLFIDEAHSIGAIGKHGRGVCEHFGVQPSTVDVLMGTFSKAFGAVGGYIAASHDIVAAIRRNLAATSSELPTPAILQQIQSSLTILQSPTGHSRLSQLAHNAAKLHHGLISHGFVVLGDPASPIVPLLLFTISKMTAFSREMLARDIAVVVVGYPATSMHTARVRLCVSAAHTDADVDRLLDACATVGDLLLLKYQR